MGTTAVFFNDEGRETSPAWRVCDLTLRHIADRLPDCMRLDMEDRGTLIDRVHDEGINVVVAGAGIDPETARGLNQLKTVLITCGTNPSLDGLADLVIDPLAVNSRSNFTGPSFLLKEALKDVGAGPLAKLLRMDGADLDTVVAQNNAETEIPEIVSLIKLKEWDTNFFGFPVAFLLCRRLTPSIEGQIEKFNEKHGIRLLEYRCNCHDRGSVLRAEAGGYSFVDVRMTFTNSHLAPSHVDYPAEMTLGRGRESDIPELREIAREIYQDSRYIYDGRFDTEKVKEFFGSWIEKAILGTYGDFAQVLYHDDRPIGFCAVRIQGRIEQGVDISLFGLDPARRGRGLGRYLLQGSLNVLAEMGANKVDVVTQGRNYAAQRLYQAGGFTTKSVELWYHKWIDPQ
jgi:ribosomal protein S18 acetylase RimI-like enzyme